MERGIIWVQDVFYLFQLSSQDQILQTTDIFIFLLCELIWRANKHSSILYYF